MFRNYKIFLLQLGQREKSKLKKKYLEVNDNEKSWEVRNQFRDSSIAVWAFTCVQLQLVFI